MWQVSDEWVKSVPTSTEVTARCEVWKAGSFTGQSLQVTGGSVRVDDTSDVRRALTLSSSDVDLMPDDLSDLLSPVSADLRVYSGRTYTEGYVEEVPVFTGGIASLNRPGLLTDMQVTADDYAGRLARARFTKPWATPAGSRIPDEIRRMVQAVLPWVTVLDLSGSQVRTKVATWDRDRWAAIKALASGIGCEVAWDPAGTLIVRPTPRVGSRAAADADWALGGDAGSLVDLGRSVTSDRVFNAVVASSSDPNYPNVSAAAYVRGGPAAWPALQAPKFYSSSLLTTVQQAQAAATALLARSSAFAQSVSPTVIPNAALDCGDLLAIVPPRDTVQQGRWLIPDPSLDALDPLLRTVSGFTLPLGPSSQAMTLTVRTDADLTVGALQ